MLGKEDQMKDAIGMNKCESCRFWHNPSKHPVGVCIRNPPTPFVLGMAPVSALVDPKRPGAEMQPIIRSYFPVIAGHEGCGQHESIEQPHSLS
jgi:hypothetical protein